MMREGGINENQTGNRNNGIAMMATVRKLQHETHGHMAA
jgi:hypothetical protein